MANQPEIPWEQALAMLPRSLVQLQAALESLALSRHLLGPEELARFEEFVSACSLLALSVLALPAKVPSQERPNVH